MPAYGSKKQAQQALQEARNRLVDARNIWKKDKSDANKAAMDQALKECNDIQHVIDRYF